LNGATSVRGSCNKQNLHKRFSEDVDLFFRILESGIHVLGHEDVVQFYRRHNKNITLDEKKSNIYHLKAIRKSLNRRRNSEGNSDELSVEFKKNGSIFDFWK